MTDITDQDRRDARQWAEAIGRSDAPCAADLWHAASRYILATVDAPDTTLAEELRHIAEHWEEWQTATINSAIKAAADRAEQIEEERDMEKTISKGWMEAHQKLAEHHAETLERDVQKDTESNAEAPNPADVKEEEPYHIYYGVYGNDHTIGVRIDGKWRCIGDDRGVHVTDTNIASLTRLVPAPRVITNPDELDALAEGSIVRDNEGDPATRRAGGLDYRGVEGVCNDVHHYLPVTVLWEPGA